MQDGPHADASLRSERIGPLPLVAELDTTTHFIMNAYCQ